MKKIINFLIFLPIILFSFCIVSSAEEYIFTTTSDFPMPYDDSIQTVNALHNVFTTSSLDSISHLIDEGIVDCVEPMSYSELFDYTPSDNYYSDQTNLTWVNTQFAWNKGNFGENVKIAVIDSGFSVAASDYNMSKLINVKDYTDTASTSFCNDTIGHGTAVVGIIAASHNSRGICGIAPNATIYIYKCFYQSEQGSSAKNSDIISAIYDSVDTYGVDIINLSSGTTDSLIFKSAVDYAYNNGTLIVAAAGNKGQSSGNILYYPASYDHAVSVGSIDETGHRASHSQRNNLVNIMAPGEDVYTLNIKSPYYFTATGTSFATPHVTAAAALAKSLNPNLTVQELMDALYLTATPMKDAYTGNGLLNIQALLTYTRATLSPATLVRSSSGKTYYYYCVPPEGYTSYFPIFNQDSVLTDISSDGIATTKESIIYYLWKKSTLEPYNGATDFLQY